MSTRFHLADLPPHLREQAAAQIDGAVPISPVTAARSAKGSSDDHLGRLRAGEMNLTETAYARDLELQRLRGEIIAWKIRLPEFEARRSDALSPRLPGDAVRPDAEDRRGEGTLA
jgi:hypothetical protein